MEKWLEAFNNNYYGRTEQARELAGFTKSAYKGGTYVPWAVMERMIYQQDPNANFEICENVVGGVVFTDSVAIETLDQTDEKMRHTSAIAFSHTVKVRVTFLGKTVTEVYPIQDSTVKGAAYTAPKAYDQNLVNNAVKRALTKAAARASGLGLGLYETGDLQFEEVPKAEVNIVKTVPQAEVNTMKTVNEEPVGVVVEVPDNLLKLAQYIHGNVELEKGIKLMNSAIFKKFKFTLKTDEPVEVIAEKLAQLEDAEKFVSALKFQSGVKND